MQENQEEGKTQNWTHLEVKQNKKFTTSGEYFVKIENNRIYVGNNFKQAFETLFKTFYINRTFCIIYVNILCSL